MITVRPSERENRRSEGDVFRWATRTALTLAEILLIGYVVYLIFGGGTLADDMENALSVVLGGLILNFGKTSSYWFSNDSLEESPGRKTKKR